MELIVDHVMFPVYNNNGYLDEVEKELKKYYKSNLNKGSQNKLYKGIYLHCDQFYIEHLSNTRGNYYWSNAICIQCDKKYWKYYKNPDSISDDFMTLVFVLHCKTKMKNDLHFSLRHSSRACREL